MDTIHSQIFIVDDDAAFSKSLARLLRSMGFTVETFLSAEDFLLQESCSTPCCLLLDVRMPGLSGPELQKELIKNNIAMPIIFLTALGDVPTGVNAMKNGAEDFLLKPVEEDRLLQAIEKALSKDSAAKELLAEEKSIQSLVRSLTPREHEVFRWILTGSLNKQIAYEIGITERTVKAHRSKVMEKLQVDSVADLVRLAQKADISPAQELPLS